MNVIANKYKINELLGKGKFGVVYKGSIIKSNSPVAIKLESFNVPVRILKHETTILNHLYVNGCRCIPSVYWFGIYQSHTCLIMNYFHSSLYDYSKTHNIKNKLDIIMVKLIEVLENIHKHFVVHRDIKPDNFMLDEHNDLFIIDFGMASVYVDSNNQHIPYNNGSKEFTIGSYRYMSYNIHNGDEPVRRDDLISIGYLYLFFKLDGLPWDDVSSGDIHNHLDIYPDLHILNNKNKIRKNKKEWTNLRSLVEDNSNIYRYLEYCYQLPFAATPNYDALKQLFISSYHTL